jgi:subtilisin family serine protease
MKARFATVLLAFLLTATSCGDANDPPEIAQTNSALSNPVRVMLTYAKPPGPGHEAAVRAAGGQVLRRWDGVAWVIHAQMPLSVARSLQSADPDIVDVRRDEGGQGSLMNATQQTGARDVLRGDDGVAYDGEGQVIAVLDSGVDDTHPDLRGRVVAWMDFLGPDGESPGFYETPEDHWGHGTGVAAAAAGSGDGAATNAYELTLSRRFPERENFGYNETFPARAAEGAQIGLFVDLLDGRGAEHCVRLLDEESDTLLRTCTTDDPIVVVLSEHGRLQNDLDTFHFTLRISSSNDDEIDSANTPYEAQLTVPFDAIDELPLTTGTAPGATIVGLKVLDDDGRFPSSEPILDALQWLHDNGAEHGVTVANASLNFSSGGPNPGVDSAVNRLVEETGIVFVASARNGQADDIPVASPATAEQAIAVGAINVYDHVTSYSSVGGEPDRIRPDVVAPGGSTRVGRLVTADSNQTACKSFARDNCVFESDRFLGDYRTYTGTSFAAPQVAGAIALVRHASNAGDPTPTSARALKAILSMTATEVGQGEEASPGVPGRAATPKDRVEGYGRINIPAAIQAVSTTWDDENEQQEGALSGDRGGRRAWARRVQLREGEGARFELRVPPDADFDLHLYAASASATGEPIVLASSATPGAGTNELTFYVSGSHREALLVVKRIDGDGTFVLQRDNAAGPDGCLAARADLVGQPCTQGLGACRATGAWLCSDDRLQLLCDAQSLPPQTELCGTGIDEDCDGVADEGFELLGTSCLLGVGACAEAGAIVCNSAGDEVECSAVAGEPATELCGNDVDDDCDGETDEGFTDRLASCSVGIGACENTAYWVCSGDRDALTCPVDPLEPAPSELCGNLVDDDCDGETDEGFDGLGAACEVGVGACRADGSLVCDASGTQLACDATAGPPQAEVCGNEIDDDCDGEIDEGCKASSEGDEGCSMQSVHAPRRWWALLFRRGISAP